MLYLCTCIFQVFLPNYAHHFHFVKTFIYIYSIRPTHRASSFEREQNPCNEKLLKTHHYIFFLCPITTSGNEKLLLIKYRPIIVVGLWCLSWNKLSELYIISWAFSTGKNVELLGLYPIRNMRAIN